MVVSCGVILDTGKIIGTWELTKAEYFTYNSITDTYLITNGTEDTTPDINQPRLSGFFYTTYPLVTMVFSDSGEFSVTATKDTEKIVIVESISGKWNLDTYNNVLTLSVTSDGTDNYGIWSTGFKFSNSWPLTTQENMQLYIKADDIGSKSIEVYETDIKAISIKGYFKKI